MLATPGVLLRQNYEYERAGTFSIFVAAESRGKKRHVQVTDRRTKEDFVAFVWRMIRRGYSQVPRVHLVVGNPNTHLRSSFEEVLGTTVVASILSRIEFHYTPVHASWLNIAEIEFGILERLCLRRCAADQAALIPKWWGGIDDATPLEVVASGRLPDAMRIRNFIGIMLRN